MRKMPKGLERLDKFLIFLSLILLCLSTWWLVMDYSGKFAERNTAKKSVGVIKSVRQVVKRKFDNSLVWYQVEESAEVYEDDWIFTGTDARVIIEFLDGGQLTVEPDSIVVLAQEKGRLQLDLTHGSFVADLKSDAEVSITKNGVKETFTATNTKLKVSDTKGSAKVAVITGTALFKGEKIKANEQLQVDQQGTTKQEAFVTLSKPANYDILWSEKMKTVEFAWESSSDVAEFYLQIAQDPEFSESVNQKITANRFTYTPPQPGTYFWRVKAFTKTKEVVLSDEYSFSFKRTLAPTPQVPVPQAQLQMEAEHEDPVFVDLEWVDTEKIWTSYGLQVAKDPNFKNLQYNFADLISEIYLAELRESGTYYWRVRGRENESGKTSAWSPTRSFELKIRRPVDRPGVTLASSDIFYQLRPPDLETVGADGQVTVDHSTNDLELRWAYDAKTIGFRVVHSRDEQGEVTLEELRVEGDSASFDRTYLGKTYFTVRPIFDNLDKAPVVKGIIHTYLPQPTTLGVSRRDQALELTWNELGLTKELAYEVEIQRNGKQPLQKLVTSSTRLKIKNAVKKMKHLAFRVRIIEPITKEPLSLYSEKSTWIPEVAPPPKVEKSIASVAPTPTQLQEKLPPPALTYPAKRKTFIVTKNSPLYTTFRWDYNLPNKEFEFEIGRGKNLEQILISKRLRSNRYVLKRTLPPGIYYYRVRAVDGDLPHDWSPAESFRVQHR